MTQTPQPQASNQTLAVQLARVEERLRSLDQKLDQVIEGRLDHEGRIRSLEQVKWMMLGLAAVVGPAATAFVNMLIKGA